MTWSEWKNAGYTVLEHITTDARNPSAAGTSTYTYIATKSGLIDLRVISASVSGYNPTYFISTVKKNTVVQTAITNILFVSNCSKEFDYSIEVAVGDVIEVIYGLTTWHTSLAGVVQLVTVNLVS